MGHRCKTRECNIIRKPKPLAYSENQSRIMLFAFIESGFFVLTAGAHSRRQLLYPSQFPEPYLPVITMFSLLSASGQQWSSQYFVRLVTSLVYPCNPDNQWIWFIHGDHCATRLPTSMRFQRFFKFLISSPSSRRCTWVQLQLFPQTPECCSRRCIL